MKLCANNSLMNFLAFLLIEGTCREVWSLFVSRNTFHGETLFLPFHPEIYPAAANVNDARKALKIKVFPGIARFRVAPPLL